MNTAVTTIDNDISASRTEKKKKKRKRKRKRRGRLPSCHLCRISLRDPDDYYLLCHVCHRSFCYNCYDEGQVQITFECTLCFRDVCDECAVRCNGTDCGMSYCLECWRINDEEGTFDKDESNLCFECVGKDNENEKGS